MPAGLNRFQWHLICQMFQLLLLWHQNSQHKIIQLFLHMQMYIIRCLLISNNNSLYI